MDDSAASRDDFFRILEGALDSGVAAVTVHGRTVAQRYEGPSDWSFLAAVKRVAGPATILGSGDLFSAEDCLSMLQTTGVDGVSVARGAIGNPWLFARARALLDGRQPPSPPTLAEQREVIREHYALAEQIYGVRRCGQMMRKFGIKYSALHPQHAEVRAAFATVANRDQWHAVLDRWYGRERHEA
jgi:tRNA-dihydrouridine synthase